MSQREVTKKTPGFETPLSGMRSLLKESMGSLTLAMSRQNPQTAELFVKILELAIADSVGDESVDYYDDLISALQLDSLSAISALFMFGLSETQVPIAWEHIKRVMSQHYYEKTMDDSGVMTDDGRNFAYPDAVVAYIDCAIECMQTPDNLPACLEQLRLVHFPGLETQVGGVFEKLEIYLKQLLTSDPAVMSMQAGLAGLMEMRKDPQNAFLLLNLIATFDANEGLASLDAATNYRFTYLIDSARDALVKRHTTNKILVENPSMAIEDDEYVGEYGTASVNYTVPGAQVAGKHLILTNYTFPTIIVSTALADPEVAQGLEGEPAQALVMSAVDDATDLIRKFNDIGALLEIPIFDLAASVDDFRSCMAAVIPGADILPPREFFGTIFRHRQILLDMDNPEINAMLNQYSRLIKDAGEQEYNMAFNADNGGENWQTFIQNLTKLHSAYQRRKYTLLDSLSLIHDTVSPRIAYIIGSFTYFNFVLYSQLKGDYDTKLDWASIDVMNATEAWG